MMGWLLFFLVVGAMGYIAWKKGMLDGVMKTLKPVFDGVKSFLDGFVGDK